MRKCIRKAFNEKFGVNGDQYASSGRINLIGEHTDYNGGFVFPGAIDKCITAEIKPNGLGENGKEVVRAYSLDVTYENNYVEFGLNEEDAPKEHWARYIFGVCREVIKRGGVIKGFDTVVAGNVPLGAGMSSSAALESTYAFALNDIFNLGIDKFELAKIGQSTEHNYCGVKCGIMDQFASVFGKEGSLIRLDCRSLEYEYFPFNPVGYKLVLLDTLVKHELASSAYNKRRESCENAAKAIRENGNPSVEFLRDATMEMLEQVKDKISAEDFMRAEYVIGEVQRVLDVCEALKVGDYTTVGAKMFETHHGMSKLYEVSCEELDFLNDVAKESGVTGSRVMGGGFGGCTINLVKDELYDEFIATAKVKYLEKYGKEPKVYDVVISNGARKLAKPTLYVLAAGMGSRYGGLKQLDGVGPSEETIMDYSIFDAIRAGFGKLVFVIRKDFEQEFNEKIVSKYKDHIPVEVVYQELANLPEGFSVPEGREKPWGTNHAVMMAEGVINEPFAVINADDFYGRESFEVLAKELMNLEGKTNQYCMVGYRVGNTMSEGGTVARGVCETNEQGYLTGIVERTQVMRIDGKVSFKDENDQWVVIDDNTPVSMNMFGFTPDYFGNSKDLFVKFLNESQGNLKAEFFIPYVVNLLINEGKSTLKVLDTTSKWFGVTYATDRPGVVEKLQSLVDAGEYPAKLF